MKDIIRNERCRPLILIALKYYDLNPIKASRPSALIRRLTFIVKASNPSEGSIHRPGRLDRDRSKVLIWPHPFCEKVYI